jgi:hypothetical protein
MYLDVDLEDGDIPPSSRTLSTQDKDVAIRRAIKLVNQSGATAGVVGIYRDNDACVGFIVLNPGDEPYFEEDEAHVDVSHIIHA